MPFFVLTAAAVILALWVMYDSGQINIEKIRLQNTADNTAYSTTTLVARDMNFIAYTNQIPKIDASSDHERLDLKRFGEFQDVIRDSRDPFTRRPPVFSSTRV